ncbi:MAG: hypothetical protein AB1733_24770 [Thermodesulfobacteriota bacterium]
MTKENPSRGKRPSALRLVVLGLGLLIGGLLAIAMVIPLTIAYHGLRNNWEALLTFPPSDEEMVAHFRAHRADFERLVQLYGQDPRHGVIIRPTREMRAIMKRIKVTWMVPDTKIWMPPDPYSEEARHEIKRLNLEWKRHRGYPEVRRFSGVILGYQHKPAIRLKNLSYIEKEYYYLPVVPQVANERLRTPTGHTRLFPTLNSYPADLVSGWCVYRQFEPQWFIRMCESDESD